MRRVDSGGLFLAESEDPALLERSAALLAHATGPLPGRKAPWPIGEILRLEEKVLARHGLRMEDLARVKPPGDRRALRARVSEITLEIQAPTTRPSASLGMLLAVTLPPGSYATTLLAHLGVELRGVSRNTEGSGSDAAPQDRRND